MAEDGANKKSIYEELDAACEPFIEDHAWRECQL